MKLPGIIRRVPFTIAMLVVIAAVGLKTATHLDRLPPTLLQRFGFAPFHISTGHLHAGDLVRLLTSAFLTLGGYGVIGCSILARVATQGQAIVAAAVLALVSATLVLLLNRVTAYKSSFKTRRD